MQYVMLIYQGTTPLPGSEASEALPGGEQQQIYADCGSINQTPGVSPGLPLGLPEEATTVRVEDGKTMTTERAPTAGGTARSAAISSSKPTNSTLRSSSLLGSRRPVSAARSRSAHRDLLVMAWTTTRRRPLRHPQPRRRRLSGGKQPHIVFISIVGSAASRLATSKPARGRGGDRGVPPPLDRPTGDAVLRLHLQWNEKPDETPHRARPQGGSFASRSTRSKSRPRLSTLRWPTIRPRSRFSCAREGPGAITPGSVRPRIRGLLPFLSPLPVEWL